MKVYFNLFHQNPFACRTRVLTATSWVCEKPFNRSSGQASSTSSLEVIAAKGLQRCSKEKMMIILKKIQADPSSALLWKPNSVAVKNLKFTNVASHFVLVQATGFQSSACPLNEPFTIFKYEVLGTYDVLGNCPSRIN